MNALDWTPQLTVGIPVYNGMPYLREAMASMFAQTYRNFEILVVVDGGHDDSLEYLRSISDPRLRIVDGPNAGLPAALNLLLAEANSPWLVRQDADDVSYPSRMERIAEWTKRHPDAGIIYSQAAYFPTDRCVGTFRDSRGTPEQLRAVVESGYLIAICHPTAVLNVERIRSIGGYAPVRHSSEDTDLWWRAALEFDLYQIPEVLVGYRLHFGSKMSQSLHRDALLGLYAQYRLLSRLWKLSPLPLEDVEGELSHLISNRQLYTKEQLRACNMALNDRRFGRAALALTNSLLSSPCHVLQRIADEYLSNKINHNGVNPALFRRRKHKLWRDQP